MNTIFQEFCLNLLGVTIPSSPLQRGLCAGTRQTGYCAVGRKMGFVAVRSKSCMVAIGQGWGTRGTVWSLLGRLGVTRSRVQGRASGETCANFVTPSFLGLRKKKNHANFTTTDFSLNKPSHSHPCSPCPKLRLLYAVCLRHWVEYVVSTDVEQVWLCPDARQEEVMIHATISAFLLLQKGTLAAVFSLTVPSPTNYS